MLDTFVLFYFAFYPYASPKRGIFLTRMQGQLNSVVSFHVESNPHSFILRPAYDVCVCVCVCVCVRVCVFTRSRGHDASRVHCQLHVMSASNHCFTNLNYEIGSKKCQ
jgi:hypothetical protein